MADNNNNTSRRGFLTSLGTAGAASLAGCAQILEGDNTDDRTDNTPPNGNSSNRNGGNGNGQSYANLSISNLEDLQITQNTSTDKTHPLELQLHGDYDEKGNLELTFENDHQQNTTELNYNNEKVEIPVTEPVAHKNKVEAELTVDGEKIDATDTFKLTPPQNYTIEPLVDGEPISNTESEFQFAKHNLNQQQHEQQHREHTRDSYIHHQGKDTLEEIEEMGNSGTILIDGEEFDLGEYTSLNELEEIVEYAGGAASDLVQENRNGTVTGGREIATITRELVEEFHDQELISLTTKHFSLDGPGSRTGIVHVDPETNTYLFQGHNGGRAVPLGEETNFRRYQDRHHTILDFKPGEAEGPTSYRQKSRATVGNLLSMSVTDLSTDTRGFMNDYFMDAATDHMVEGGDIYEIKNWTDQVINVMETIDQEDLGTQYVGLTLDPEDDLKDTELIVTDDKDIYQQVMEEPEPTSRTEIKNTLGL